MAESEDSLVISSKALPAAKKLSLDLRGLNWRTIEGYLVIAYKCGYDEIEIVFGDTQTFDIIKKIIHTVLHGFEVVEQTKNNCTIKNVSTINESEFNTMFRRNFLIVLSLGKLCLEMIKSKDYGSLSEIVSLKETSDKFYAFCCRLIITNHAVTKTKSYFYYVILWVLDKIGDRYRDLCKYLMEYEGKNVSLSGDVLKIFEQVNSMVESYHKIFYTYKVEDIYSISCEQSRLLIEIRNQMNTRKDMDRITLEYLLSVTKRIDDLISSCIGLNLK